MTENLLRSILEKVQQVNIAVYGDFCLDAYWLLDPAGGEISVETGLRTEAVRTQYYTLGGASNVVANLAALKPKSITLVGVTGDDLFGRELRRQFQTLRVDTTDLITQKDNYDTVVFSKRILNEREQPRIDFGFFNRRSKETDDRIIQNLRSVLKSCDAMIFNQQVPGGLSDDFIDDANAAFDEFSEKIILLDSRHYGDRFRNVYRKTNAREAAQLVGFDNETALDLIQLEDMAQELYSQFLKPVFLTRGDRGLLTVDQTGLTHIPGLHFLKKLDTVGAGDTVMSALAVALAAGYSSAVAADFANLAAGVTVQKRFQTGTASGDEIIALNNEAHYIHQPELAEQPNQARFYHDSNIEICSDLDTLKTGRITHIIFDHDGTISTLREGWETVMQDVLLRCILGKHLTQVDNEEYQRILSHVRDYIDMTAGQQTILQMQGLVEMIKEFGHVPENEIHDKFFYKTRFNNELIKIVEKRIARITVGELSVGDFSIKGILPFLEKLHARDILLYLASGTDDEDVRHEASVLGIAQLFNGGIYGAVGDVSKFSKRLLIERIIREHDLKGPELLVFGDGPVEMQECRKVGGIAVGVASDEIRRYGLHCKKRERLIKAGAQVIIPDYSQGDQLLNILFNLTYNA